jgi:DnaJ-class molecular chaperone
MSKEEKSLEVKIQPGMMPGHMIVFPGESSDSPDFTEAGDVVIHLQAADEATHWVREGEDLHTTVLIQYHEALTGCSKAVANHPGYETPLVITVKPGVRHGDVIRFKGYGMPKRNSQEKGDAVITVQLTPASPFEHMTLLAESQRLKELFRYQPYEFTGREHVVS